MKNLLYILCLLVSISVNSQTLFPDVKAYVSSSTNYMKQGFLEAKGFLFTLTDTFPAKYPTLIKHTNGKYYQTAGNGAAWSEFQSGSGGSTGGGTSIAGVASFNGRTGSVVPLSADYSAFYSLSGHTHIKSQVGLANVDNTSDINKPVSSAQSATIIFKIDSAYNANTFTLRNAGGTGNNLLYMPGGNVAIAKRQIFNGNVLQVDSDTSTTYTIGASSIKVLPDANYSILSTDYTLILTEPATTRTLTLPAASIMANKEINISCRSTANGRWVLSGSFVQKATTGANPIAVDFSNSGLVSGTNYHLVSDGIKWYDISN
jgi:hypothetical protein